jgi:hypothetical protein
MSSRRSQRGELHRDHVQAEVEVLAEVADETASRERRLVAAMTRTSTRASDAPTGNLASCRTRSSLAQVGADLADPSRNSVPPLARSKRPEPRPW